MQRLSRSERRQVNPTQHLGLSQGTARNDNDGSDSPCVQETPILQSCDIRTTPIRHPCDSHATAQGAPLAGPACVNEFPREPLCRFVDDLAAAPRVEVDASTGRTIRIGAYQIYQKLHRDLPPTKLYAYGLNERTAHYPGPTLVARRGIATKVRWENHLRDKTHMFAVDYTLMGVAHPKRGGIPIVIHRHGGETPSHSDGHPQAWFTQFGETGPTYHSRRYTYPNDQQPATLWYHDHAVGITRLNVAAGMAGLYLLTDPKGVERKLRTRLPGPEFTVPLAISDRSFFANGSINYPSKGWVPEYFGDTILVSGLVWPYLSVRRTRYRFRVLGAASSRFFNLRFVCAAPDNYPDFTPPIAGHVLPITQIGTDGGYLPRPVTRSSLLLAPGERHDILVDFSSLPASCADVILTNDAPAPFPSGEAPGRNATGVVMRFIVDSTGCVVLSPPVPKKLVSLPKLRLSRVSKERWMTAVEVSSPQRITFDGRGFSDAPTETPKRNSEELWHIINNTPDAHPIHLHLIMHRPLARRPFNRTAYRNSQCAFPGNSSANSSLPTCFTGAGSSVRVSRRAGSVGEYERGWKDTTVLQRDEVLTLWTGWFSQDGSPFPFNPTRGPGYVWHCHILEHEDNDMMRPLIIT
ncbi:unnamed protein product [Closterium sp. Naga37s-1]|nr:unnamed protein product [Closterium sp. Naga37s-1]